MSGHFNEVVDHAMSDDDSELGKTKAELAYALFSLEREIAIAQQAQASNAALVKALEEIEGVSDNCINAERYTAADSLGDLQEIRNIIKRLRAVVATGQEP